jgi:hypothetical protein
MQRAGGTAEGERYAVSLAVVQAGYESLAMKVCVHGISLFIVASRKDSLSFLGKPCETAEPVTIS